MQVFLRTDSFAKLFFCLTSIGLLCYIVLAFYTYHTAYLNVPRMRKYQIRREVSLPTPTMMPENGLKYILMWTILNNSSDYNEGMLPFIDSKCPNTNCYLTSNRNLRYNDHKNFDAIVFDAKNLKYWKKLPLSRYENQKYIFYSTVPSSEVTICDIITDEYFNWTCTYRLDSDIVVPFIEVYDSSGNLVAPKSDVKWEKDISRLSNQDAKKIANKTKAMAWIPEKCENVSGDIMSYVERLQETFRENSLDFDIYGCGYKTCLSKNCLEVLHDYYFYFTFEYSDSEDYVTKEVLKAFKTYTVPVVIGENDYQKFLPDESYINVANASNEKFATTIEYIIRNPTVYSTYHRWRKHYIIREANPFAGFCKICEYLHNEEKVDESTVKVNFREWWHEGPLFDSCFPRRRESISDVISYANETHRYEDVVIE